MIKFPIINYQLSIINYFIVLLFLATVNSCVPIYNSQSSIGSSSSNVASIYNPYITSLHPNYQVFRRDDNSTIVVAKIYRSEILFNDANPEKTKKGKVLFKLNLYKIENESRTLVDTLKFQYDVEMKSYEKIFFAYFPLKTELDAKYSLHIIYSDLLKQKFAVSYIDIADGTKNTGQNYLTTSYNAAYPAFEKYFKNNEYFKIQENVLQDTALFVEYFTYKYPLPRPPASITKPELPKAIADTVYTLQAKSNLTLMQHNEGMYRYTKDTTSHNGLTLFTLTNKEYPRVKTSKQMVLPLQYLVSAKEYKKLTTVSNQKLALDKFWLSLAKGDEEKARQLIRIFYTRVMFANNYFLSHSEGWKTDRGMIYIIYGPPKIIQKNFKKEKWIYGSSRNSNNLAFTFYKREHQFSNNHFELLRNNIYSSSWRKAVKSWRAGLVYSGQ